MTDPEHLAFLANRRDAERARMEVAWDVAEAAWGPIEALNERIANGVIHIGNHPEDTKARGLLARLRKQRTRLIADHEDALAEFRRLEEVYLMSVRECGLFGLIEGGNGDAP